MDGFEDESIILSRLLDKLGYGENMNMLRKECFANNSRYLSQWDTGEYKIMCGSKGEGISKHYENDVDCLTILKDIICTEHVRKYVNCETTSVFYTDMEQTSAGYTLLRMEICKQLETDIVLENLVGLPGGVYLSAEGWKLSITEAYTSGMIENGVATLDVKLMHNWRGPSIPTCNLLSGIQADNVFGLECECPTLLVSWLSRSRSQKWPTPDLLRAVSKSRIHLVPTGNVESSLQLLEWRICLTEAEMILIQNLNPTYTKALILLKAVTKRTLKPICKEISSYVVKNVILWIAENEDSETVPETRLVAIFQEGLKFLKSCIWKNNLPNYMIERRNLFAGRLTRRSRLCARIDFLLREGPRAVLRCKTINHCLEMMLHFPAVLRRELVRLRAYELLQIKANELILKIFSISNLLSTDLTQLHLVLLQNEDYVFLLNFIADEYRDDAVSNANEYEITESVVAEIIPCLRSNIPLAFGL